MDSLRVALVHDYLNQFGGAERVLLTLAEMFPQAPIYTLFYEPGVFNGHFKGREIKTSFLSNYGKFRFLLYFLNFFEK